MTVYLCQWIVAFAYLLSGKKSRSAAAVACVIAASCITLSSGGGADAYIYFEKAVADWSGTLDYPSVFIGFKALSHFGVQEPLGISWRSWYAVTFAAPFFIDITVNGPSSSGLRRAVFAIFFGTILGLGMVYGEIRQALALIYVIFGVSFVSRDSNKLGLALITVSLLMHITAWIFCAIYFTARTQLRLKSVVIFISVMGSMLFLLWWSIDDLYKSQLLKHLRSFQGFSSPGLIYLLGSYLILMTGVKPRLGLWKVKDFIISVFIISVALFDYTGVRLGIVGALAHWMSAHEHLRYQANQKQFILLLMMHLTLALRSFFVDGFPAFETLRF